MARPADPASRNCHPLPSPITSSRWPATTRGRTIACSTRAAGFRRPISSRRGRASSPRSRRRSITSSPSTGITSTRWSGRFRGEPPNREPSIASSTPEEPFATCAELQQAQRAVDRRLDRCVRRADRRAARMPGAGATPRRHPDRECDAAPRAPVPAPDPSSRPGARDARRNPGQAAAARRILLRERSASARGRARRARLSEAAIWGRCSAG